MRKTKQNTIKELEEIDKKAIDMWSRIRALTKFKPTLRSLLDISFEFAFEKVAPKIKN